MDEGLLSIDWAQVLGGLDLSDSWDFLVDKIIQLIELYVPENKVVRSVRQGKSIYQPGMYRSHKS